MRIEKIYKVPTGEIVIVHGERGMLEMLSLGDYGKEVNIKCDALGLSREPKPVKHTNLLPLRKKWVITISTQYGCTMDCEFCDVPKVGPGRNASLLDMLNQVDVGLNLHPEVLGSERLNVHFARMGEPTWNLEVLEAARVMHDRLSAVHAVHPVVSTMMPKRNRLLHPFIHDWMRIKNKVYGGNAGLQISINSTSETERERMFRGNACSLETIGNIMRATLMSNSIQGRKITLNFALAGYEIDPAVLKKHFSPMHFIVKLTPMHLTRSATEKGLETAGDFTHYQPYTEYEERLKDAGYEVLVFLPSREEDESRITCGNAILSGTRPAVCIP